MQSKRLDEYSKRLKYQPWPLNLTLEARFAIRLMMIPSFAFDTKEAASRLNVPISMNEISGSLQEGKPAFAGGTDV